MSHYLSLWVMWVIDARQVGDDQVAPEALRRRRAGRASLRRGEDHLAVTSYNLQLTSYKLQVTSYKLQENTATDIVKDFAVADCKL